MLDTKALAEATAAIVKAHVDAAVAPLQRRIDDLEKRQPEPGTAGADGKDGASATDEQIASAVAGYMAANPPAVGKDGRDGADGRDGKDGKDGLQGEKGIDGKDGVSLAGGMIDRAGSLVVTLSTGEQKTLGQVVGNDGRDGKDGAPGEKGADGRDGLGFDDFDVVESEDGLMLRFVRGDFVKEFHIPVPLDRGVWVEKMHKKGACVTWGGSLWIAQRDTGAKPDTADSGWRLAVKRGRDGKDAK